MSWSVEEYAEKVRRIRKLLKDKELDYVIVASQVNFYWLTGGRPYINRLGDKACADIVVTKEKEYLVANNIEVNRLVTEELAGLPLEIASYNWWEDAGKVIERIIRGRKGVVDVQLGIDFAKLRFKLIDAEVERFIDAGKSVAKVLDAVAYEVQPGDSEMDVLAKIKTAAIKYDVDPWVSLAAADERAYEYRHPLPTSKRINKYVLLSISGQKHGLYASVTRLLHFGKVADELRKRYQAVLNVEAAFITNTLPRYKIKDVFNLGCQAYKDNGYENEWHFHHQGGLAGYNSRELRATSTCELEIDSNQVFAWNPTIAGVKAEDTILVTNDGPKILTASELYPIVEIKYNKVVLKRPDILVR